jgi:hypothetical protein
MALSAGEAIRMVIAPRYVVTAAAMAELFDRHLSVKNSQDVWRSTENCDCVLSVLDIVFIQFLKEDLDIEIDLAKFANITTFKEISC